MQVARRLLASLHRDQRGQALMWMIGLTVIALMTGAIAVDLGVWLRDLRFAQNKADAVVLAAVLELPEPGESSAREVAEAWFQHNVAPEVRDRAHLECCDFEDRDGDGRSDTVRARVSLDSRSFFARLIGFGDPKVSKAAAAMRVRARGSSVLPWAVQGANDNENEFFGLDQQIRNGKPVAFHSERFCRPRCDSFLGPGNFNALAVDGNGVPPYRQAIMNEAGSSNVILEDGTVQVPSETGTLGINTCEPLYTRASRYESDVPPCGSRTSDAQLASCDVTYQEGQQRALELAQNPICRLTRVVVIPVVDHLGPGKTSARVYGLAIFYIAGWDRTNPYGDFDYDGDGTGEYVWGYLLPPERVLPAMSLLVDPDNPSTNPLAPLLAVLIE
jgi:hypothetical protein